MLNDKQTILQTDVLDEVSKKFSVNSLRVLASRYLFRDTDNVIIESPEQLFRRVAVHIAISDLLHDEDLYDRTPKHLSSHGELSTLSKLSIGKYELNSAHKDAFIRLYKELNQQGRMIFNLEDIIEMVNDGRFNDYERNIEEYELLMTEQIFMPNSPTLMNAGGGLGQLSACFVLDINDDMGDIMDTAKDSAMIFKSGGGVGINYSKLRGEGEIVKSTTGVASGPVSFMEIINTITNVVKQGGKRRGANMGILNADHPDIKKFIENKKTPGVLENFNISVGMWKSPEDYEHIDLIAESAWSSAEPGVIFFDNANKYNVFASARGGPVNITNPCGEQFLYPNESCNLGSINISKFVLGYNTDSTPFFDWAGFIKYVGISTRFLDNVIDVNKYPTEAIMIASKESRRIGIGVMGVADALYMLNIPYNSKEGFDFQEKVAEVLTYTSMDESVEIAKKRGKFPLCDSSDYTLGKLPVSGYYEGGRNVLWDNLINKIKRFGIRNVLTSTIAPTGSISMIAECSSGMEPNFALAYKKSVAVGEFYYVNSILRDVLAKRGILTAKLEAKIASNKGSVQGIDEIPEDIQRVFVTAMDLSWEDHVRVQAVWQRWIGNSISKTINMPESATIEDVKNSYILGHKLGLKGLTIYRDNSRHEQVLTT